MADEDKANKNGALSTLDIFGTVVDICTGLLMLFLFGPLFYAFKYDLASSSHTTFGALVLGIFPAFVHLFEDLRLSTVTPWLLLGIAFILGIISRGIFILYTVLPTNRWIEKWMVRGSVKLVGKWHGLEDKWNSGVVLSRLFTGNPFGRVGDPSYSKYRASMLDPTSELNKSKPYWDYEMFLFIRASHFYGLLFTFLSVYFLYGLSAVALMWRNISLHDILPWIGVLLIIEIVILGLLQEVIIHGVAFVTIDDLLYEYFVSASK